MLTVFDLPVGSIDHDIIVNDLVTDFYSHLNLRHLDWMNAVQHMSSITVYYGGSRQQSLINHIDNGVGNST